jgi:hypothetical protein
MRPAGSRRENESNAGRHGLTTWALTMLLLSYLLSSLPADFSEDLAASRTPVSIGSNQLSKTCGDASAAGGAQKGFVISLVMAWSPARRFNAG